MYIYISMISLVSNEIDPRCRVDDCRTLSLGRGEIMKIVVIGGTGLIGSKVVEQLKQKDHEASAAAPSTGVNTITGEGLADVLAGAEVVVDVANSPSFEDRPSMDFFQTAGKNLTAAETPSMTLDLLDIPTSSAEFDRYMESQIELKKVNHNLSEWETKHKILTSYSCGIRILSII